MPPFIRRSSRLPHHDEENSPATVNATAVQPQHRRGRNLAPAEVPLSRQPSENTLYEDLQHLPWEPPRPKDTLDELTQLSTSWNKADAWSRTAAMVQDNHNSQLSRCNEELDYFLVYSSIFSGILTAFNVQAYPLLRPTSSNPSASEQIETPTTSIVVLNTLWFIGLIFSLSATTFGVLIKQWLHDYHVDRCTAKESARRVLYRSANMKTWKVQSIISGLFIMLQCSLALFFSGLLVLLWTLHTVVATIATAFVVLVFTLIAATFVLPAFYSSCCFSSPPAKLCYFVVQWLKYFCQLVLRKYIYPILQPVASLLCVKLHLPRYPTAVVTWDQRDQASIVTSSPKLDSDLVISTVLGPTLSKNALANGRPAKALPKDDAILHLLVDLDVDNVRSCFRAVHEKTKVSGEGIRGAVVPMDFWVVSLLNLLVFHERERDSGVESDINVALSYICYAMEACKCSPTQSHALLQTLSIAVLRLRGSLQRDASRLIRRMLSPAQSGVEVYSWSVIRYAALALEQHFQELHEERFNRDRWDDILGIIDLLVQCSMRDIPKWKVEQPIEENDALRLCAQRALDVFSDILAVTKPSSDPEACVEPKHLGLFALIGRRLASVVGVLADVPHPRQEHIQEFVREQVEPWLRATRGKLPAVVILTDDRLEASVAIGQAEAAWRRFEGEM